MIQTACPSCNSRSIDQTNRFDLTIVDKDECRHDFECYDCGALFTVSYAPIAVALVAKPEREVEHV